MKMQKKDWFFLGTGVVFGVLGFLFYFFPGILLNLSSNEIKKIAPQVKGEEASSWSEDWRVVGYLNVKVFGEGQFTERAIGPARWKVTGQIGDRIFEETWTAGGAELNIENLLNENGWLRMTNPKQDASGDDIKELINLHTRIGTCAGVTGDRRCIHLGNNIYGVVYTFSDAPKNNSSAPKQSYSTARGYYSWEIDDRREGIYNSGEFVFPTVWHVEGQFK